ncbi:MAG: HlyD family efflux transporter periplasmic adaptor subunit [Dolichospermum sp. DET73]|nr:HlyD family efflux transporter periplasmic adaptor subunit [Dolichospermum sp. DET73]
MLSNPNPNSLPLVNSEEFLPPISHWINLGGLFIVGAGGVAVILASVIKYNVIISASATVRPTGELQIIQTPMEGTVKSIFVRENEVVSQEKEIAIIEDSRLQTKKSQLQSNIQYNSQQRDQIDQQLTALDRQIAAESDRTKNTVFSAQADLIRTQRDFEDKQVTTQAEVQEADANLKFSQDELQKAQTELISIESRLRAAYAILKTSKSKWNRYQKIEKQGALAKNLLDEAELAVTQQEEEVKSQKALVEGQKTAIKRQQRAVEAAMARRKRVLAFVNPSKAIVAIAQQRISQEKAGGEATLATLNREQEALRQRRIEIQNQIARDHKELEQVQIDLSKSLIKNRIDGTIVKLNLRNPGQQVQRGEVIAQILPHNASLVIKSLVRTQDRDKVAIGQDVHIRIDSCPYPNFGTLKGTVKEISADATLPQNIGTSGNNSATMTTQSNSNGMEKGAYYEVTIQPKSFSLSQGDRRCVIKSGMEGRSDIISRQETVIQFILRKARLITDL